MTATIPEAALDLFQKKAFAHLATLMPHGSPHVTPMWVDFDGTHILINTAKGRQKDCNMRKNAKVALDIQDPDNPYRYLGIRGKVVEVIEQGADEHIDKMMLKYTGQARYPWRAPGEVRVIFKIKPERVWGVGG